MVLIKGLDQLGNRRYKSGTRRTQQLRKRWKATGKVTGTVGVPGNMKRLGAPIYKLGAEDRFIVDEVEIDWGISDDPSDEEVILIVLFVPNEFISADAIKMIDDSELVDLRIWRTSGTLLTIETTAGKLRLPDGEILERATDDADQESTDAFPTRFGTDLTIAVTSTTTTSLVAVYKASGFQEYDLIQRSQPMSEWAGYEFEETNDDEGSEED